MNTRPRRILVLLMCVFVLLVMIACPVSTYPTPDAEATGEFYYLRETAVSWTPAPVATDSGK